MIDLAIKSLGLDWVPGKGFHYPAGSYVEYQLQNDQTYDLENTKTQIQDEYNLLVEKNLPIKISFDETKIYKGEMLRKVSFDGLCPCPCGGTHVDSTADLAAFEISKIKIKGGVAKLSYKIS